MLRFGIVGAGIAGLTVAIGLGRDGHRVVAFDRREILDEVGAGLQLSPNATRAARHLGLLDAIESVATESQGVLMRRASDGAAVATIPLGTSARARYGAPFLLVHRADLQRVLADEARRQAGFQLLTSTTVTESDSTAGTIRARRGSGLFSGSFDGIVRADGLRSGAATSGTQVGPTFRGMTAWRALVPATDLPAEFREPRSTVWLGPRAHVVHYPVRNATLVNVIAVTEEGGRPASAEDLWSALGDQAQLHRQLSGWHPTLRTLVDAAPAWRTWPLFDAARPTWSVGRETVVGDAAHPMLPFLAQGASQAFEDAQALREAVAGASGGVADAFQQYARSRVPRTRRIQAASARQGRIYHLAGPASVARDLALRVMGPQKLLARMDWVYGRHEACLTTTS